MLVGHAKAALEDDMTPHYRLKQMFACKTNASWQTDRQADRLADQPSISI